MEAVINRHSEGLLFNELLLVRLLNVNPIIVVFVGWMKFDYKSLHLLQNTAYKLT